MAIIDALVAHPPPLRDEEGILRIGQTRVRLDSVIAAFQNGCSPEEILLKFPSLDLTDIYAVITYYLWRRAEVEEYLERRRDESERVRVENEKRFPNDGIRQRLLS